MTRNKLLLSAFVIVSIVGLACGSGSGDDDGGQGGSAAGGGAGTGSAGTTGAAGVGVAGQGGSGGGAAVAGGGGTSSTAGTTGGGGSAAGGTTGAAGAGAAGTTGVAGRGGSGGAGAAGRGGSGGGGAVGGGGGSSGSSGGGAGATSTGGRGGATAGTTGTAGSGGAGAPKFHVFLLLGQSNMAGYPKAQDADKVKNERIRVLGFDACAATGRQLDKWDVAVAPLHECWNGALGPGDYFAKTIIDKIPAGDTIGLVPCAISGEKIETFLKVGGSKYTWIVQRAKLAQQAGGVIEGMLFHQGESNTGDSTWPGKVNTLVTDLRAELGIGNVPFLAGELAYDGGSATHNTQVNRLPTVVTNAFVVSASGLALDPADTQWHLHFGHDAQVTFGKRYAAKMIEALHW